MEYLDNRKSFFEAVSKKKNIGSYDEFLKKIESPDNRKNLFDALSESYNIGTFEEYESKLGFSNQDTLKQDTPIQATPNQKSYVSGGEQAFTQSDEALRQDKPANKFAELFRNPHQENYFKDISDREAREKEKISYVIDPYQDDDLTQFTPKKEQTYQDIMINQSELFKATPKGQEAYSKLMEKQTSVLGKYIDKYKNTPEYRRHVENYQKEYSTAVGDEQKATIDKKYNALLEERLHSLYGTEMNTELEPAMGEYLNALYETRQTSIDGATQRLGRTYTQAKLPEIKQSINDALSEHQNSPEYKKARDKEFKRQEIAAMFKPELAHTTFATTELNLSLNPVMRQLNAAKKRIEKSEDMIEAALQGKGLGAGFIDQAKRINNWTYGFNDFIENSDVRQVIEKAEKDENSLTKSEKALLDAVALEACAIQYFSYQLSRGYKAGTTTAASVPFMIEFMVNPLSGAGRALAKTLGGWAIKRGITGFGLKSLTFGSRMLGDMLGAAGMTATSSIGRVASGVEERMIGNVGSYADVEGVHFAGREGEQTFGEAVRNSVADNLVENYSEMFFGAFEGGSKAIRGFLKSSPLKGLPKTKVFEIAKNLFSSYDKFQRAVQFHGYLGEVSEEYIGNLLRLGVTTDTEASDVFNEDAQIDTWLGLLPTSAAFGIIGVSGRGINKYSRYKDTHRMNYEKFKASLSSQELASFENVEAHINAGDTEFTKDYIKETLHNKELNDAQKIERLNAVYGAMYDKNYDDFREVEIASIEERLHNNHYNKNTNGIMTVATDKKSGNIVFVTGAADNGELIVEGIDGKQETVPADRLEDMKSVDYYSTLKSIAEGEFARRRVERLYKEGDEVQDKDGNNFTVSQLSDNGVIIKNSEGEEAEVPFMYFDDNFTSKAEVDIDKADAEIDKQTNSTNGRVTNVKIGGKEGVFYIKAGNLVAYKDDNDNVIIDKEHSDETFVVVDAETGEAKQVGINQIDEVLGDAAPIELKEQSHDEIRNAAENKNTFPVGALVYNEEMPNVFTTVIDNGGYGFSIATVNEKTGRLENVPISNDAKEGWKTLNLSEGNVLQTNLSKFEIISNEGNGNLIVSIDGGEAVRMGTAELSERLQYEGFNLSSYIENESKKAEQKEQTPEQLQKEQTPEQLQEEEDDQYSDADLYATVKALYKKREKQEKIANNPIDLTDQKAIKARETAKKNVELLTEELAKWQAIINKRDERKKAEREKQNAISEERRAAIEAERIKQKELERIEREKAQGVPDVSVDNAEDARKRGYRIETGRMVERQQPQYGLIGNEREVVFSSKDKVTGKYKVVEAETLQESHINGKRNTKFFLTEAQPKERTDKASQMAAQKIAENLNPKQITEGTTAYVGTPITNTRGEIIQGNNRTSALKYMYSQAPEKSAEYKQFLIDNADSFGLNSEEIAAMKNPVLVTEIDVTDEEAIRLGQKNAQDTESGGIQRIDSEKTAKSLGDGLYQFTSRLMQSNDEEQSLSSTIEQNGRDALKILLSKNLINETQYQSAFNNKGELTPEAKEDLAGIVESIVFANSKNDNIKTMFNSLPQAAKKAILQTVARDAFNSEDVKVVPYIQEAIEIYYSLSLDTVFASAKTIEDVRKAAWSWSIQSQTDFVGNLFFPSQKYTNFALELAVMFKSQTMATQRAKFNELYDKLQGVGGDMFSETELLPFRDAVEKIYNVKLNKELGHVTNDGSHVLEVGSELGEERERGGTRGTRGDEQATSGARSADNREGVAGDNRQGTSNRQTKEEMSEKRAIAEGVTKKLNIDIEFVENPDELPDSEIKARRAIQEGEKVGGWYNPKTNKAYLYIPNVTTANEVEKTILHEVVAHKGLRGLLGKEQFNALCDSVWQQMTGKERLYWTEYVLGVKTGQAHPLDIARAIGSQANRRAAADEFMANMAENGIENKTAWQKIVEFVKDALRKMGFGKAFTDRELIEKDIKKLLSKSYKRQTRNKENSITNEKESDVRFRFVDNTEYIKDDLEEEKNKYGGKRYKIVGDDIIVSTYFVVENSDQYSEIRYASASFDKALDYAKDYYDNDIDSDYVTIDLESIERAIPISEFKENNEEIWGNSFNEFEGSLENYIDTYIDDYLDNAGVDVGYETDEEPVRFVIQKGERDNKYTDKLIWDVEDEIERRFGVKVGKYSSFYVNREGNITDAYEDEQGRENLSVTMRISDHTHNPANGKDDLNVLIADKDATSRRFFTSTEDLVFNSDYTADEIVDEIEEYWRNYARDNYNGDELDIRFRTTAYHGSPHKVDKFSTDYIGTGEGAQAFGWGLYFTSIKDIAKEYATMRKGGVGKNLPVIDNINRALKERGIKEYDKYSLIDFADALIENEGDFQKTLNQLEKWAKHDNTGELQELFDDISLLDAEVGNNLLGEANLYSVTIHKDKTPDQYTWLEWDKPVTERQKEAVRRVFDEITNNEPDYHKASELSNQFAKYDFEGKTGEDIYREISDALWSDKYKPKGDSDKRASLLLLKNGIDGIKYPAESIARGTTSDNARGFNYVVFDENAVSIDEHIRFRIGNKRKADMKAGLLNKLTNATEEQVERTISEIEKLGEDVKAGGDSKTEKVAYHWALKGTVILPEDNDKILQAIKVAEISKVNPMEYNSPMELINNHDHIKLKEKPIDPDTVHTLTNKKDLGNGITIYNVEESEDSRENMRKIINTHLGNKRSPWCLLQGDENGNLTEQSAKYWKYYNGIPKRVAFYEGRLIAFSANDSNNVVWWDKQDKPTKGIPITHKIPNDELERTGTTEYNEETGLYGEYSNIHRGNKENGLYEKWYDNGQMWVRTTYKDGERNGLYEEWHDNGQMFMRTTLLDNYINGLYERWYYNGQMFMRGTFKDDGKRDGLYEEWYDNGQIKTRAIYKDGERKLLPTDVSLQELVDRGELDKKYLYDENEGEGVLFRRENANKQSSESKTLEEYKSKFENPKDIITFALEENTISYGSKQKANETLRETVRNITETGKLRDDSGRKYILHDNNAQSGSKEPDSVIKKVTKRTVLKDFKESGFVEFAGTKIESPQDIADLFSIHRSPNIEKFHLIFVDDKGVILGTHAYTINLSNQALLPNQDVISDTYRKYNASGVYFLHNHPSGNQKVSIQDVASTDFMYKKLAEEGQNLIGHVVIDTDKFSYINISEKAYKGENYNQSLLSNYINEQVEEYEYKNAQAKLFSEREFIGSGKEAPKRLLEISKALLTANSSKGAIVYLTANLDVAAYDVFPDSAKESDIIKIAEQGYKNNLGSRIAFVHDGSYSFPLRMPHFTLDVIDIHRGSMEFVTENRETPTINQLWESQSEYRKGSKELEAIAKEIQSLKDKAIADGTFMLAPNGKSTNLNEKQWVQVRTKAFKDWFGDWENDPENASKVVDENGEPLVVYHGGGANIIAFDYDKIGMQGRSEGAGFEFTENIELAKNYAKNHGEGLYSVFLNIKNPIKDVNQKTLSRAQKVKLLTKFNEKVNANEAYTSDLGKDVIFSDYTETQNIPKAIIEIVNMLVDDTDLDFINEFINTTHMNKEILEAFKEVTGYDGVILDKTDEWTKNGLYVVFTNTQIKSAIDNVGTFDSENEDIRFASSPTEQQRQAINYINEIADSETVKDAEASTNYRKAYIERYEALKAKLTAKNPNIVETYQDVLKYLEALANDKTWSRWDKSARPQLKSIRDSVKELKKAGSIRGLKNKLDKAVDIVLERQNETARRIIKNFVNQKLEGKKGKGVRIPKLVDDTTRHFFDSIKEWINKDSQSIDNELQKLQNEYETKKEGNEKNKLEAQIKAFTYIQYYKSDIKRSEDNISNIIIEINKLSKEYTLKDIRKEISSRYSLIAKNKKRLEKADERTKVDIIEENINLKKEIEDKQKEYKLLKQSITLSKANKGQLETLKTALLNERISMQNSMETFIKQLDMVLREGIKAKRLFSEKEEIKKHAILKDIYLEFAMSEMESVINPAKKESKLAVWRKMFLDPIYTFSYMLKSFAIYSPDGRGRLYERFFTNGVLVARQKELNGIEEATKAIDVKIIEIFGEGNHITQVQNICNKFNGASITIKTKVNKLNAEKGEYEVIEQEHIQEINNGQALYLYAIAKMPDGMIKLYAMGIDQEQIDAVTTTLDPKLIEFMDWVQDEYLPVLRAKYNDTHIDLFGTQLDQIDKYFPLNIDRSAIPSEVDIENKGNFFGLPTTITGSIIKRVFNKHAIDIRNSDAIETLINHVQSMEKWNAYAPVIKDLNILNSNNTFKKHIDRYIFHGAANLFKDTCAIAVGSYVPKGSIVEDVITTLTKLYARSKIVLRLTPALKQGLGIVQIIGEADPKFMENAIKNIANPLSIKWALDNLPLFRERWKGRLGGDDRLSLTRETIEGAAKKIMDIINKTSNIGMIPNAAVDLYVCGVMAKTMYETKYNFYKNERGYSTEESIDKALKDAEIVYNESQQSAEDMYLSRTQKDRTFMAASISLFNNASFSYNRLFFEGLTAVLKQIKPKGRERLKATQKAKYIVEGRTPEVAEQYAKNDVNRALAKGIMQIGLNGYLVQFVWNVGSSIGIMKALKYILVLFGDDDRDKEIAIDNFKEDMRNSAIKSLTTPVRGLPGGKELESLTELYLKGWNIRQMNVESNPLITDTKQTFNDLSEGYKNNDWVKIVNALVRYSSGFTGVDLNTIANVTYGIYDLIENHENLTTSDVLLDLSLIINSPMSEQKFLAVSRRDNDTFEDIVNRYIELKRLHKYGSFTPFTDKEDSKAKQDVAKIINVRYHTLKDMLNEYDKAIETYNKFHTDDYIDLYDNPSYKNASDLKYELEYTAKNDILNETQLGALKTAIESLEKDESLNEIYKKAKKDAWSTSRQKEPELE